MNKDIESSLDAFRLNAPRYSRAERYYNGDHDLRFATEKFANTFGSLFREFALNLCPVVCDAVRDKLRVNGFDLDNVPIDAQVEGADTRRIWNRNRMAVRAGEVHKEALKTGDAYILVWPDTQGRAVMYPQRASNIAIAYDEESPGRVMRAAKYWRDADRRVRINLFYPDRIEKYVSKAETDAPLSDAGKFTTAGATIPNPFGVVPVFHFANNSDIGLPGRSELEAAIPIQDGLNKATLDMLVAMEFSAFRQRWAAGIEVERQPDGGLVSPFTSGVEHLWIASEAGAKFGDFEATDLEQFLRVKDSFRIDIACVTGTPIHYFIQQTQGFRSGESLRQASARFIAKVRDRQRSFGQIWADAMAFALAVEGNEGVDVVTRWDDPSPLSEREQLENLILKLQIGLTTDRALIEAGYGAADLATRGK